METNKNHKLYYSISEVSQILNLSPSKIRFWEKEFPAFLKPKKSRNGKRMFTLSDIEILKKILFLTRDKGYTLSGANKILLSEKKKIDTHLELKKTLTETKSFLVELKSLLSRT